MEKELKPFIYVRVHYEDGNQMSTQIRLTPQEAFNYYLGNFWTYWDTIRQGEYIRRAVKVEILNKEGKPYWEASI